MNNKIFSKSIKNFNKLNEDQKFFVSHFIGFAEELYKHGDSSLIDILEVQKNNETELLNTIANIMLKYKIDNNQMKINRSNRNRLIREFDKTIENYIKLEYKEESIKTTRVLNELAQNKYLSNQYLLGLGMDFTVNKIPKKDLGRILNHKITGKNYSDRIWANKNEIAKKLKVDIRKFLDGEINANQIEKQIRNRYGINRTYSQRLVRNEICRVQNSVNEQFFEDNNGEYLLYSATLDTRTCSKCASDDGKIFSVNDISRPELPRHVNDRCTYILLPDKDYRPSSRLDNKTKENIDYKSYEEWLENNNL